MATFDGDQLPGTNFPDILPLNIIATQDFRFRPFDVAFCIFRIEDWSRKLVRTRIFTTRFLVQIKHEPLIVKTVATFTNNDI